MANDDLAIACQTRAVVTGDASTGSVSRMIGVVVMAPPPPVLVAGRDNPAAPATMRPRPRAAAIGPKDRDRPAPPGALPHGRWWPRSRPGPWPTGVRTRR